MCDTTTSDKSLGAETTSKKSNCPYNHNCANCPFSKQQDTKERIQLPDTK